jgi:hypothetical protein
MVTQHFEHSSFREKLIEHLLVSGILRHLWLHGVTAAEILKPEVDNGGYDIVLSCKSVTRHVQLKSSFQKASTSAQSINIRLADKPSGCVVWVQFDPENLELGPFFWFGGAPGHPLPDLTTFPIAKHTKANARGEKLLRPNVRKVPRKAFRAIDGIRSLVEVLLGDVCQWQSPPASAVVAVASNDEPENLQSGGAEAG